jgi:hypothetical protein
MRAFIKSLLSVLACVLLASCGGGGGSGNNTAFEPAGLVVSVSPASVATTPGSIVGVTVNARNSNGAPVADGTTVTLRVSPPGAGLVSGTTGTSTPLGESATATTSGGLANFRFYGRSLGTATLTASVQDQGRTISGNTTINVAAGPSNDTRLTIQASATSLPQKPGNLSFNQSVFFGSPYISEITVTQRDLNGNIINPPSAGTGSGTTGCGSTGGIGAAVGPGLTPSGLWLPAEGFDTNGNVIICRQIVAPVNSGVTVFYLVADSTSGPVTLTVSSVDPQTGETISAQRQFQIVSGAPALPGSVVVTSDGFPVYVQGTNGAQSKQLQVNVFDGASNIIPNAATGTNNVTLEIVGGAQGGERLVGVNAAGQSVSGSSISVRTNNGVALFTYQSGTRQGIITVRATADRADNNVDNGVTDPVTSTYGFAVSDGKLFDLVITSPSANAVFVNGSSTTLNVILPNGTTSCSNVGLANCVLLPLAPNGTYSLTVSALCTDRFGNPCVGGTEIKFGMIDYPKVPDGTAFAIRGGDGDPQESGTLFTAPTGAFTTAGGGAGPGDTLVVFGHIPTAPPGNRDLESARTIQSVNSATSLNVTYRFNPNDDTGVSVNNGPVLPYVIGRATSGNILVSAQTNALGVATTILTYPVSRVGTLAVLWAQGSGPIVGGQAKLVTYATYARFVGLNPGQLTATPSTIPGNTTAPVQVCLRDALNVGIQGAPVSFAFTNLTGTGSVNGVQTSGTLPQVTDITGCVTANVTTGGVTPGGTTPTVVFTSLGQSASVTIVAGQLILQATPSTFTGAGEATIRLRLLDGSGNPVNGAQLTVSCQASGDAQLNVIRQPGVTGAPQAGVTPQNGPGETTALIDAVGFNTCGSPPTGSCTFSTATGSPSTTVQFKGLDLSDINASPPCP